MKLPVRYLLPKSEPTADKMTDQLIKVGDRKRDRLYHDDGFLRLIE